MYTHTQPWLGEYWRGLRERERERGGEREREERVERDRIIRSENKLANFFLALLLLGPGTCRLTVEPRAREIHSAVPLIVCQVGSGRSCF